MTHRAHRRILSFEIIGDNWSPIDNWGQSKIKYCIILQENAIVESMARLQRIAPKNIPIPIIQRGNNRQVCSGSDGNYAAYATLVKGILKRYKERCDRDRTFFVHEISVQEIEQIRSATNKSMVVGNDRFQEETEALTGRRDKEKISNSR